MKEWKVEELTEEELESLQMTADGQPSCRAELSGPGDGEDGAEDYHDPDGVVDGSDNA